ncbi:unnamed protein product [Moneuplotes crassus]|uniref:Uncharacterized protein n=1 Tax=Euplotes crassus TaxID=5936 RepID=A0AAD1X6G9_EUPCR|nr:unnamed protein product [Moneuplotes crassus]
MFDKSPKITDQFCNFLDENFQTLKALRSLVFQYKGFLYVEHHGLWDRICEDLKLQEGCDFNAAQAAKIYKQYFYLYDTLKVYRLDRNYYCFIQNYDQNFMTTGRTLNLPLDFRVNNTYQKSEEIFQKNCEEFQLLYLTEKCTVRYQNFCSTFMVDQDVFSISKIIKSSGRNKICMAHFVKRPKDEKMRFAKPFQTDYLIDSLRVLIADKYELGSQSELIDAEEGEIFKEIEIPIDGGSDIIKHMDSHFPHCILPWRSMLKCANEEVVGVNKPEILYSDPKFIQTWKKGYRGLTEFYLNISQTPICFLIVKVGKNRSFEDIIDRLGCTIDDEEEEQKLGRKRAKKCEDSDLQYVLDPFELRDAKYNLEICPHFFASHRCEVSIFQLGKGELLSIRSGYYYQYFIPSGPGMRASTMLHWHSLIHRHEEIETFISQCSSPLKSEPPCNLGGLKTLINFANTHAYISYKNPLKFYRRIVQEAVKKEYKERKELLSYYCKAIERRYEKHFTEKEEAEQKAKEDAERKANLKALEVLQDTKQTNMGTQDVEMTDKDKSNDEPKDSKTGQKELTRKGFRIKECYVCSTTIAEFEDNPLLKWRYPIFEYTKNPHKARFCQLCNKEIVIYFLRLVKCAKIRSEMEVHYISCINCGIEKAIHNRNSDFRIMEFLKRMSVRKLMHFGCIALVIDEKDIDREKSLDFSYNMTRQELKRYELMKLYDPDENLTINKKEIIESESDSCDDKTKHRELHEDIEFKSIFFMNSQVPIFLKRDQMEKEIFLNVESNLNEKMHVNLGIFLSAATLAKNNKEKKDQKKAKKEEKGKSDKDICIYKPKKCAKQEIKQDAKMEVKTSSQDLNENLKQELLKKEPRREKRRSRMKLTIKNQNWSFESIVFQIISNHSTILRKRLITETIINRIPECLMCGRVHPKMIRVQKCQKISQDYLSNKQSGRCNQGVFKTSKEDYEEAQKPQEKIGGSY